MQVHSIVETTPEEQAEADNGRYIIVATDLLWRPVFPPQMCTPRNGLVTAVWEPVEKHRRWKLPTMVEVGGARVTPPWSSNTYLCRLHEGVVTAELCCEFTLYCNVSLFEQAR